ISGDLLEEYRDSIYPSRGQWRANVWFVCQAAGFAWRATWMWAVLFTALALARETLDWFLPPLDFTIRSSITTYLAMVLFITLGCWRAWRTGSLRASAISAVVAGAIAAILQMIGTMLLFAIWHDPQTRWAIAHSGGLSESLELPWLVILPATVLAIAG